VWSVVCPGLTLDLGQPGHVRAFACGLWFGNEYLVVTAPDWYESPIAYLNAHRIEVEHTDCPPWMWRWEEITSDSSHDEEAQASVAPPMPIHSRQVQFHRNTGDMNPAPVSEVEVREVRRTWTDGDIEDAIQFDRILLFRCADGSRFSLSVDDSGIAGDLILAYSQKTVDSELEDSIIRVSIS
jgi:hypothetical protein